MNSQDIREILVELWDKAFCSKHIRDFYGLEKALSQLSALNKIDGIVCPRCCEIFHDEDMRKNPKDYWTCQSCGTIQHRKCRGSL